MRKTLCLFAILLVTLNASSQSKDEKETYSVDELKQDFNILRSSLEEGHPALYRYVTKKDLDAIFDSAAASITKPMSDREFMLLVSRVVARIGDGHLVVVPPKTGLDKLDEGPTAIPFQVLTNNGKLYVVRNYASLADTEFLGSQIISINGHQIDDFLKEYISIAASDGANITSKYRKLERPRLLTRYFYMLYGYSESYRVEYVPLNESTAKTAVLPGLIFDKLFEMYQKRYSAAATAPPSEFNIAAQDQYAYLRISSFDKEQLENNKIKLPKFLETSFKSIADGKINNLILDLRGNGGGTDEFGRLLFSYFISEPFDYYESLRMNKESYNFFKYTNLPGGMKAPEGMLKANAEGSFDNIQHPNVGKQSPSLPTYSGNIYVLINGACFSTTSEFLSMLHFRTKAIFIGEESGGGYYGNSSGPTPDLKLPNTKVRLQIPLMKYTMAVKGYQFKDRGVIPQYPVVPSIKDRLDNKNVELDVARDLIKKSMTKAN